MPHSVLERVKFMMIFRRFVTGTTLIAALSAPAIADTGGTTAGDAGTEFSETLDRPLFSKSRRPYVAPTAEPEIEREPEAAPVLAAAPSDAAPEPMLHPSDLVLSGVFRRGERMIALVEQRADGKSVKLEIGAGRVLSGTGETVDVEVTQITADSLTLRAGAPLVFKLRSPAPRDEITVERIAAEPARWAMLNQGAPIRTRATETPSQAYLLPTGVTRDAGFVVGGETN